MDTESDEFRTALRVAAESFATHPDDAERAARLISAALGWSMPRARWFIEVNREHLRRAEP